MKRNRFVLLFIVWIISVACASLSRNSSSKIIQTKDIEDIPLLTTHEPNVLKILGSPTETNKRREINWIYRDGQNYQKALLSFDLTTDQLIYKYVVPSNAEPEQSVNYLIHTKFQNLNFEKVEFPLCGLDAYSSESILVDLKAGVLINYLKNRDDVMSIAWMTPLMAHEQVQSVFRCKYK